MPVYLIKFDVCPSPNDIFVRCALLLQLFVVQFEVLWILLQRFSIFKRILHDCDLQWIMLKRSSETWLKKNFSQVIIDLYHHGPDSVLGYYCVVVVFGDLKWSFTTETLCLPLKHNHFSDMKTGVYKTNFRFSMTPFTRRCDRALL